MCPAEKNRLSVQTLVILNHSVVILAEVVKQYYPSGKLKTECNLKDGKKNDIEKEYYETGNLMGEWNYKNSKYDGISKAYWENGNLMFEYSYKNDEREGISKDYYESGKLLAETNYKKGKHEGIGKTYYESGQLESRNNFINGKLEGVSSDYYESGKLKEEISWKDDKMEGIRREYNESGNLIKEGNYKNGKLDGILIIYDDSGMLVVRAKYKDGELVRMQETDNANGKLISKPLKDDFVADEKGFTPKQYGKMGAKKKTDTIIIFIGVTVIVLLFFIWRIIKNFSLKTSDLIKLVSAEIIMDKGNNFHISFIKHHPQLQIHEYVRLLLHYYAKILYNFDPNDFEMSAFSSRLKSLMDGIINKGIQDTNLLDSVRLPSQISSRFSDIKLSDRVRLVSNKPDQDTRKIVATLYFVN